MFVTLWDEWTSLLHSFLDIRVEISDNKNRENEQDCEENDECGWW